MISFNLQFFGGRGSGGGNKVSANASRTAAAAVSKPTLTESAAPKKTAAKKTEKSNSLSVGSTYSSLNDLYSAIYNKGYTVTLRAEDTDTTIMKMVLAERSNDSKKIIQRSDWLNLDGIDRREYEMRGYKPGREQRIIINTKNGYTIKKVEKL